MATPLEIFNMAMALTDNLDDTGRADTSDNREYKNRTLAILNTLLNEVYPYSDTWQKPVGRKRPICPKVESFDQEIELDERICYDVLTEGLAALLFHDENPTMANVHLQLYQERLMSLKRGEGLMTGSEDIVDVYSGVYIDGVYYTGNSFPYNNHGEW